MNDARPLPRIRYLPDARIDAALDGEIRALLTRCFTKRNCSGPRPRRAGT